MKKRILFYDRIIINFRKYIPDVIQNLYNDSEVDILLAYDEEDYESKSFYEERGIKLHKTKLFEKHYNIIKEFKPDILVVNAQRISDTSLVVFAKKQGITTIMIQHGMYIPFLKRESQFFIQKFAMILRYIYYSFSIAKTIGKQPKTVLSDFYKVFVKGRKYKDTISYSVELNTDYVLVYGNYWKDYHNVNFGYNHSQQYVIGYHELRRVDKIFTKKFEDNAICYIAQTLVEDGRFDESKFCNFIEVLSRISEKCKVYIKLHPRSKKEFYKNKGLVLLEDEIPNCEYYLGHYSSLLALFAYTKGTLITWEFDNHPIPKYFKDISVKVKAEKELINVLDKKMIDKETKIEHYFSRSYSTQKVIDFIKQNRLNIKS